MGPVVSSIWGAAQPERSPRDAAVSHRFSLGHDDGWEPGWSNQGVWVLDGSDCPVLGPTARRGCSWPMSLVDKGPPESWTSDKATRLASAWARRSSHGPDGCSRFPGGLGDYWTNRCGVGPVSGIRASPCETVSAGPWSSAATSCRRTPGVRLRVAEGSQGPRSYLFSAQRVHRPAGASPAKSTGPCRNRDGSEPRYYLSNAPEDTPLETLASGRSRCPSV